MPFCDRVAQTCVKARLRKDRGALYQVLCTLVGCQDAELGATLDELLLVKRPFAK